MYPPIYQLCNADAGVKALIPDGASHIRLYSFGNAPQGVVKPYAVHQLINGTPENYLGCRPDSDYATIQVDVYSDQASEVRTVAEALRDALEGDAYITSWRGESRDPDTLNYRFSFDVSFITNR